MQMCLRASIAISAAIIVQLSGWAVAAGLASEQAPSAQRDATKFTEPPGQETDVMKRIIDQAKAALESGKSTTDILTDSSYLTAHEWPRFRKLIRDSAQPSPVTIVTAKEPGQTLTVAGRVVDGRGQPVKNAVMYFYQTSARGWYSDRAAHVGGMEGDRKHARLFGYLKANEEGRFELRTIRPATRTATFPLIYTSKSNRPTIRPRASSLRFNSTTTRDSPPNGGSARSKKVFSLPRSRRIPRTRSAWRSNSKCTSRTRRCT